MFRLLRGLTSLVLLATGVYLAVTVPLGSRTLWQHLRAIAATEESQALWEGVGDKVSQAFVDISRDSEHSGSKERSTSPSTEDSGAYQSRTGSQRDIPTGARSTGEPVEAAGKPTGPPAGDSQAELTRNDRENLRQLVRDSLR